MAASLKIPPYGRQEASFDWSRDCLFSRLFRLTATKRQRLLITTGGPSNANELPLHRASDIESVSMLWRQLDGWQPCFIISLVVVRWLIHQGGLSFRQWLGSCLVMRPANIPWSILLGPQFHCLFNSLFGLTTKKTSRQRVPAPLWRELMYYREFPLHKGPVLRKCFHVIILTNAVSFVWNKIQYNDITNISSQKELQGRLQSISAILTQPHWVDICFIRTYEE